MSQDDLESFKIKKVSSTLIINQSQTDLHQATPFPH